MNINGLLSRLERIGAMCWMPTKMFLKYKYRRVTGKRLDLDNPKTFNEKLQWLKVYDRKPEYTRMVDKYEAKKYVAGIIGEEHIIPTLGVWDRFDDIDFDTLPNQFVLKCTHDSGGLAICRDKSSFDFEKAKRKIEKSLRRNYYWYGREWAYKNVRPRVIAERYLEEAKPGCCLGLTDYKFFCYNGVPQMLYVSEGLENHKTARMSFYDMTGEELPFRRSDYAVRGLPLKLPENYLHMKKLVIRLSEAIAVPFVRIDLYSIGEAVYFSEITFYPCGGMIPFEPSEWDSILGDWIDLSTIKK